MTNQEIRNKLEEIGVTKEDFFRDFNVSVQNYYRALKARSKMIKPTQTTIKINRLFDQIMAAKTIGEYRSIIPANKIKAVRSNEISLVNTKPSPDFNIILENNKMLLKLLDYYLEKEKK
jgi:hypothetical protein